MQTKELYLLSFFRTARTFEGQFWANKFTSAVAEEAHNTIKQASPEIKKLFSSENHDS